MFRVLVPSDGSERALHAVSQVTSLAPHLQSRAEVLLLNVQPRVPARLYLLGGTPSELERLEEPLREAGQAALAPARALLERAGITHSCHVEIGETAETIVRFAKSHHCEMIVMATRGMGAASSLMLGSIATKVLHLAEVPVLMVR